MAGYAQGSAQDVEAIPLWEVADKLILCVEDQQSRQVPDTYDNLKIVIVDAAKMIALVLSAQLKQPGPFVCAFSIVSTLYVARGHMTLFFQDKMYKLWKDFMTLAYYGGADAVKGLKHLHETGQKVMKNSLKKMEGVIFPELYKKVAIKMHNDRTDLQSLQKSIAPIIIEQRVMMHLDHPNNIHYV